MQFKKVRIGLDLDDKIKDLIVNTQENFLRYAKQENIKLTIINDLHLTLDYFTEITGEKLIERQQDLYQKKEIIKNIPLYNPQERFDETLHKFTLRESNVTGEIFVVLTTHNPNPIYNTLITNQNISAHTSIAKIEQMSPERRKKIESELKNIWKDHIS